jgi:hypothetical protein
MLRCWPEREAKMKGVFVHPLPIHSFHEEKSIVIFIGRQIFNSEEYSHMRMIDQVSHVWVIAFSRL